MGKVLKVAAAVVGVAALFIPGVGAFIQAGIYAAMATVGVSGTVALTLSAAIAGAAIGSGLSAALSISGLGPQPPKLPRASVDRLRAGLDPRAARKIVFGHTAAALDVHYQEYTGSNQDSFNSVIVLASHEIREIEEIWFDETKVIDGATTVDSESIGHLSVVHRLKGTVANAFTITGSSTWVASTCRLVGSAYMWLRYDVGNKNSPYSQNIPTRITAKVRGAIPYDPRRDSTRGGSGSHRADDQTTWWWENDDTGRNPALQLLWYLIGWRIQNPADGTWKLAVGLGLPLDRINFASFIAAANICDEPVALAVGGTEPRYRSDGVFSEDDAPEVVFSNLLAAMNGVLRDAGGQLTLDILKNDLGTPVADFTAADVIGEFSWVQTPPIDQTFNVVRGQYVDSSDAGLFQMVDYPDVEVESVDGIERATQFSFAMVQSASQAQRLAKAYLQRAQFPSTFSADFLASAWRCQVGSVIRFTFPALGFNNKLFRVTQHSILPDGRCPMVLREEDASIYAWDADERPAVVATAPIRYNPLNGALPREVASAGELITEVAAAVDDVATAVDGVSAAVDGVSATVDAGLNPDGTVKDGKVDVAAIVPGAVTRQYTQLQSSPVVVTTSGETVTLVSLNIDLEPDDILTVIGSVSVSSSEAGGQWTINYEGSAIAAAGVFVASHTTSTHYSTSVAPGMVGTRTISLVTLNTTGGYSRTYSDARLTVTISRR